MTSFCVPAIDAESLEALRSLDDVQLCQRIMEWVVALRPIALQHGAEVARLAGLPVGEVVASPASFRTICFAVQAGATTVHHETRAPIAAEAAQRGGDEVESQLHGIWDAGVLHIGKYQSFKQDEPFATYNPNHVAKWAPHELLHRACGFFWADGMTRFELYTSSRLNEALPVALWYGWDECCRLQSMGFDRANTAASMVADKADALWLTESETDLRARVHSTVSHFRWGLDHAAAEFALVERELIERGLFEAEHPFLAPSSDARAYVVGHFDRLSERSHAMLFGQFLKAGSDYFDDVSSYLQHLEHLAHRLLSVPFQFDEAAHASALARRRVWDLAIRAASLGWSGFRSLVPLFRSAFENPSADQQRLRDALAAMEPRLLATGASDGGVTETLLEGFESLSPPTAVWCRGEGAETLGAAWRAGLLLQRSPLRSRLAQWVHGDAAVPQAVRERFALELVIATAELRDDNVEHLCDAVPDSGESRLVASSAFVLLDLPWTLLLARAEDDGVEMELPTIAAEQYAGLMVGNVRGQVAILPLPTVVTALWQRASETPVSAAEAASLLDGWLAEFDDGSWPETGHEWLEELAAAGLFGFLG